MSGTKVEHLIVLMLENRSFDHMLGYLEYPDEAGFEGIRGKERQFGNPLADDSTVYPGNNASYFIDPGPSHSHESVMRQLLGNGSRTRPYPLTNNGYAADYEANQGSGGLALACFIPDRLPVLAELARQFAVCDHWFCSVPGATWPNRNFTHAATSDGEVNIVMRQYFNKTIFEQLSEAGRDWAVYYGGFPALTMAFVNTWDTPQGNNWVQRFKPMQNLYRAIQYDRLPHYAFVEPDMLGRVTNSQHPSLGGEENFKAGEQLIWSLYTTLRANPRVFEKTLLLITYDEHGGFFDHVPPPQGPEWSVPQVYRDPNSGYTFPFDLLGPRVPTVLVSPWIAPGTVDHTVYDHTSILATARKIARAELPPLTPRDDRANTFDRVLNLDSPRAELPDIAEPFVDQTLRRPFEHVELSESVAYVLRHLIWSRIATHHDAYIQQATQHSGMEMGMLDQVILPNLVHQVIQTDIAPNLSPKAQAKLAAFDPIQAIQEIPAAVAYLLHFYPVTTGLHLALATIQERITRFLVDQELVDEAMQFADLVMRRFFEGHHILLRTAAGDTLPDPDLPAIRAALDALRVDPDPHSRLWLADHLDRWLVVERNGFVVLNDQPAGDYFLENASADTVIQLILFFTTGNIARLRAGMKKVEKSALDSNLPVSPGGDPNPPARIG